MAHTSRIVVRWLLRRAAGGTTGGRRRGLPKAASAKARFTTTWSTALAPENSTMLPRIARNLISTVTAPERAWHADGRAGGAGAEAPEVVRRSQPSTRDHTDEDTVAEQAGG